MGYPTNNQRNKNNFEDYAMDQEANQAQMKFEYRVACTRAQGMEDTRQVNEVLTAYVATDLYCHLNIYRYCNNGRIRCTPLTLNPCIISCAVFTSINSQKILEIKINILKKTSSFFCDLEKIKWKKIIEKMGESGVVFNLDIKLEKQAEAIKSYVMQMVSCTNATFVPLFRGWYNIEGKIQFAEEKITWHHMKALCRF